MDDQHDREQTDDSAGASNDDLYASLNPRQQKAIIALVTEPTIAKAAESAAVSESTLHRWLLDETFTKAYRRARRETFSQAIALAGSGSGIRMNATPTPVFRLGLRHCMLV